MSILETSQIIFNLVASISVIVVAVLVSIIAFNIIKFFNSIKNLSDSINKESAEIYNKINKFFESIMNLSFVSKYFKKKNHGKK